MKKLRAVLIASVCLSVLATLAWAAQERNSAADNLPSGYWTFGAQPYVGEDFKKLPVITTGVTSDPRKGLGVTGVEVSNASSKTVSALKFTWYVLEDKAPDEVLLQGQTQLIAIPGGLAPKDEQRLQ